MFSKLLLPPPPLRIFRPSYGPDALVAKRKQGQVSHILPALYLIPPGWDRGVGIRKNAQILQRSRFGHITKSSRVASLRKHSGKPSAGAEAGKLTMFYHVSVIFRAKASLLQNQSFSFARHRVVFYQHSELYGQ